MQVRKPDAPISANAPTPLMNAPEHSPIADSSRLTDTWRKRASPAYCVMSWVIQPSGRLATSEMPHSAVASTICRATRSPPPPPAMLWTPGQTTFVGWVERSETHQHRSPQVPWWVSLSLNPPYATDDR